MAFLNDEDPAENVKKFVVLYGKSNDEFHRKDIRKYAWTKVDESIGIYRMVDCVYNKAVNSTGSRDVSRITAISEMEFFVTIVNWGVLRAIEPFVL